MPEIAEVETVRNTLKKRILHKKILDVKIYYKPIVLNDEKEIKENLIHKEFIDIKRMGKWLLFETDTHYLLSHLRMEGKYFLKKQNDPLEKHEHIEILFEDGMSMRYHDTRKFGRMKLVKKEELYNFEGIKKQGIEPISNDLTKEYLFSKISKKNIPIKTILLDQTIISGLGNIYADEVLFDAKISPFRKGKDITLEECERIKNSSKKIIIAAIKDGGTTIRSYTSSLGVTGRFQQHLMVHNKAGKFCDICGTKIEKTTVNGRGTYYCRMCQDTHEVSLEQFYLDVLGFQDMPEFLKKYGLVPSLKRLKKVGYFCGMDYASKHIFNFKEYISRYDHSISVALLTYKMTKDKLATLSALFHDIATPCFSHVIDYMNGDYMTQESTEEYTEQILKQDKQIVNLLKEDSMELEKIMNFKKYSIVDNKRPKICADRLDEIITSSIAWTQNITKKDIVEIIDDLTIFKNEEGKDELGFSKSRIAQKVLKINQKIDEFCHSKEDMYMMNLLANITKLFIEKKEISYKDLYKYDEEKLWYIMKNTKDKEMQDVIKKFETITSIPDLKYSEIKKRVLNPLVNGKRLLK